MTNGGLISRILVATDGSEESLRAAQYAAQIAKCTNAEAVILHAAEVSGITQFVTYAMEAAPRRERAVRQTGEVVVEKTKKPFLEADVKVHTKIIEGFAADVILREAEDGKYDLIAMGSRGAGTSLAERVFLGLGSVAERVIGSAPCPVLVVRA